MANHFFIYNVPGYGDIPVMQSVSPDSGAIVLVSTKGKGMPFLAGSVLKKSAELSEGWKSISGLLEYMKSNPNKNWIFEDGGIKFNNAKQPKLVYKQFSSGTNKFGDLAEGVASKLGSIAGVSERPYGYKMPKKGIQLRIDLAKGDSVTASWNPDKDNPDSCLFDVTLKGDSRRLTANINDKSDDIVKAIKAKFE